MVAGLLWLASLAVAGPQCDEAPLTAVGTDVVSYNAGVVEVPLLPLDLGFDALHTRSVLPCLRVGGRLHSYTSLWEAELGNDGEAGVELQNKLHVAVGTELTLHRRVSVAAYVLPGVRVATVRQVVEYPEHDIDRVYVSTAVIPSLYAYGAVRFWPLPRVGLHIDGQVTPVDRFREYGWYPNRMVGAGVSLRGKTVSTPSDAVSAR